MELAEFIAVVKTRPLPANPMARVRTLAKELAEGAAEKVWGIAIYSFRGAINDSEVNTYLAERWGDNAPSVGLLVSNDFIRVVQDNTQQAQLFITKSAFDLLDITEPASIFISYRREDSSAFALLILARLKAEGLNAFLDLTIQPGDNWREHIKAEIQSRENFVLLLGGQTLTSEVVSQEVKWALEAGKNIMPIWHNRFKYTPGEFRIDAEIDRTLQDVHTIRVLEESALAYNNAIVELLNRFGVTP